MIAGRNIYNRSDRVCHKAFCITRTLSFNTVIFRVGWGFISLRYNCGRGLDAKLKSGYSLLVQRSYLASTVGGCRSRPRMMLV